MSNGDTVEDQNLLELMMMYINTEERRENNIEPHCCVYIPGVGRTDVTLYAAVGLTHGGWSASTAAAIARSQSLSSFVIQQQGLLLLKAGPNVSRRDAMFM